MNTFIWILILETDYSPLLVEGKHTIPYQDLSIQNKILLEIMKAIKASDNQSIPAPSEAPVVNVSVDLDLITEKLDLIVSALKAPQLEETQAELHAAQKFSESLQQQLSDQSDELVISQNRIDSQMQEITYLTTELESSNDTIADLKAKLSKIDALLTTTDEPT